MNEKRYSRGKLESLAVIYVAAMLGNYVYRGRRRRFVLPNYYIRGQSRKRMFYAWLRFARLYRQYPELRNACRRFYTTENPFPWPK